MMYLLCDDSQGTIYFSLLSCEVCLMTHLSQLCCVSYLKESMGALKCCRGKTITGLELTGRASLLFRYMSFIQYSYT